MSYCSLKCYGTPGTFSHHFLKSVNPVYTIAVPGAHNESCDRLEQVISFLTQLTRDSSPRFLHGDMEKERKKGRKRALLIALFVLYALC